MPLTNSKSTQLGVLPPRAELAIPVFPPLTGEMVPVVFCRVGDIIVTLPGPDRVVLRSTVDSPTGYVLVFAPAAVVRLARVPWAQLAKLGAEYLKSMLKDVGNAPPQTPK